MPKCCMCNKIKDSKQFYKDIHRSNGYSSRCKECKSKYSKQNKTKRRKITDKNKVRCYICGYEKCKSALEFHHIKDKQANISQIGTINLIKDEISKCIVLCANCHRELHENKLVLLQVNSG